MKFPISKTRRRVWIRRIKSLWTDYSHNKIGLLGLAILILFAIAGVFADLIAPYSISEYRLADKTAMPQWLTIFPQYSNLPPTINTRLEWSYGHISINETDKVNVEWNTTKGLVVQFSANESATEPVHILFYKNFSYNYDPPNTFTAKFTYSAIPNIINITEQIGEYNYTLTYGMAEYSIEILIIDPNGTIYSLWDTYSDTGRRPGFVPGENEPTPPFSVPLTQTVKRLLPVPIESVFISARCGFDVVDFIRRIPIFKQTGNFTLVLDIAFNPLRYKETENVPSTCEIEVKTGELKILGLVHGILGCDNMGRDVFTQLVLGIRISFTIGILAAIVSSVLGITFGVVAGYVGGFVDEAIMRIVDILLCLPALPLLLVLVSMYGKNVYYIVILIAIFGWQGLSRVVRSQVLSLRETPFVECAKASGASKNYIMLKHMVPNVIPVALASMVLAVPGAILTEAALSFLGFGANVPTWGRMLSRARGAGAFGRLIWWWVVPPGLAITLICVAFVFIGHALDEVVNPKLRRRR